MRKANVYLRGTFAGELTETPTNKYVFRYDDNYFYNPAKTSISLTLDKKQQEYKSNFLFPFFANLLSEGQNRTIQAKLFQIDEKDDFGILLASAQNDVSGAITIEPV